MPPTRSRPAPAPAEEEALKALEAFPGVSIINDRANNRFPTPLDASTKAGCPGQARPSALACATMRSQG